MVMTNQILSNWGGVTHIYFGELTTFASDNDFSFDRRQVIIWTNAGISFCGPLGTHLSEILIDILIFSFKQMRLKVPSAKWWRFCLGCDVLIWPPSIMIWPRSKGYTAALQCVMEFWLYTFEILLKWPWQKVLKWEIV